MRRLSTPLLIYRASRNQRIGSGQQTAYKLSVNMSMVIIEFQLHMNGLVAYLLRCSVIGGLFSVVFVRPRDSPLH